jgi:hypothetical protein
MRGALAPTASPLERAIHDTYSNAVADEMYLDPVYDAFIKSQRLRSRAAIIAAHPDLFPGKGTWFDNDDDPDFHVSLYVSEDLPGVVRYVHQTRASAYEDRPIKYRVSELGPDLTFRDLASS